MSLGSVISTDKPESIAKFCFACVLTIGKKIPSTLKLYRRIDVFHRYSIPDQIQEKSRKLTVHDYWNDIIHEILDQIGQQLVTKVFVFSRSSRDGYDMPVTSND